MTEQVIFKIDKKLKDQAMKKAQADGLPFSHVLKMATHAYVKGDLEIGLMVKEEFNAKTRKRLDRILKDIKAGKNLSPAFKSAEEMRDYLKNKR